MFGTLRGKVERTLQLDVLYEIAGEAVHYKCLVAILDGVQDYILVREVQSTKLQKKHGTNIHTFTHHSLKLIWRH